MHGNCLCGSFQMDIASNYTLLCFAKATLAKHVLVSKKSGDTE